MIKGIRSKSAIWAWVNPIDFRSLRNTCSRISSELYNENSFLAVPGGTYLAARAIIFAMPAQKDDRAALERERDELPALITTYEHELLSTPVEEMEKREQLRWQLRLAEQRLAEINARLTQ